MDLSDGTRQSAKILLAFYYINKREMYPDYMQRFIQFRDAAGWDRPAPYLQHYPATETSITGRNVCFHCASNYVNGSQHHVLTSHCASCKRASSPAYEIDRLTYHLGIHPVFIEQILAEVMIERKNYELAQSIIQRSSATAQLPEEIPTVQTRGQEPTV